MQYINRHRHWPYLLAALLLLMQSFAIWHDVSHPFHIADVECERFESISHTPTADLTHNISPIWTGTFSLVQAPLTITFQQQRLRDNHSIRAPPIFS